MEEVTLELFEEKNRMYQELSTIHRAKEMKEERNYGRQRQTSATRETHTTNTQTGSSSSSR